MSDDELEALRAEVKTLRAERDKALALFNALFAGMVAPKKRGRPISVHTQEASASRRVGAPAIDEGAGENVSEQIDAYIARGSGRTRISAIEAYVDWCIKNRISKRVSRDDRRLWIDRIVRQDRRERAARKPRTFIP